MITLNQKINNPNKTINIKLKKHYKNTSFYNKQNHMHNNISFSGISISKGWQRLSEKADDIFIAPAKKYFKETTDKINSSIKQSDKEALKKDDKNLEDIAEDIGAKREKIKGKFFVIRKRKKIKKLNNQEVGLKKDSLGQKNEKVDDIVQKTVNASQEAEQLPAKLGELDRSHHLERIKKSSKINKINSSYNKLKGFDKIAGYKHVKQVFADHIVEEIENEKLGKPADVPGSILFFGPTGNGKSTFAKVFADATSCKKIPLRTDYSLPKIEQERQFMDKLEKLAIQAKERFEKTKVRTIIFADEVDKVANKEHLDTKTGELMPESTILGELEDFMETCSEKYHCTLFSATNNPLVLGLDMKNDTNFPVRIAIDPPDKDNLTEVFKHYLKGRTDSNIDYTTLAKEALGREEGTFNNSQIKDICEKAHAKKGKSLNQQDVINYMKETKPSIDKNTMAKFDQETQAFMTDEV